MADPFLQLNWGKKPEVKGVFLYLEESRRIMH